MTLPRFPTYLLSSQPVIDACTEALQKDRFFILALDGRDGAGKTTFGHHLALYTGRQFLDTDLFLKRGLDVEPTHTKDLTPILRRWRRRNRPIIMAGIFINKLLSEMGYPADILVRVIGVNRQGNVAWSELFEAYERAYLPNERIFLACLEADRLDRKCFMLEKEPSLGCDGVNPCNWCEAQSKIQQRTECPWW